MAQKLFLKEQEKKLLANATCDDCRDKQPVVKLFCPWGAATWLLFSIDPNMDEAFGLCYLGDIDNMEYGYVSIKEIMSIRGPGGLKIERDAHFTASKTFKEYEQDARKVGYLSA